jgi:hypothetical protein
MKSVGVNVQENATFYTHFISIDVKNIYFKVVFHVNYL